MEHDLKRLDYLADPKVIDFTDWATHLLNGDWHLNHAWVGKGLLFQCDTVVEAFNKYRWPNSINGEGFAGTMERFDRFRSVFDNIGDITTVAKQDQWIYNARKIVEWGGINNLRALDKWSTMEPEHLQQHISDAKRLLNPVTGTTDGLRDFKFMTSGFSKIYSALVPNFPIYDSRVACALACLVRIFCKWKNITDVPPVLDFGIPAHRGSQRCQHPAIRYYQTAKYAQTNLRAAWLLGKLVEPPSKFDEIDAPHRMYALQSALFMIGYARLADDAIHESV